MDTILCVLTENVILDFSFKITTNIILVVIKVNLHSQYRSAHEATPLLTCNFLFSTFKYIIWHLLGIFAKVI